MKKIVIARCGECPFIEEGYRENDKGQLVCGLAPLEIVDLDKIHLDCELSDN